MLFPSDVFQQSQYRFYTALLNIQYPKRQINQTCLPHATDIAEEISSFGGTINSSLLQLYTVLSLGRPSGFIPGLSDLSIFITQHRETASCWTTITLLTSHQLIAL